MTAASVTGVDAASLTRLRSQLGAANVLWAGSGGVRVDDDGWSAVSGTASVVHNVAFCAAGGDALEAAVEEILGWGVPGVLMVAGDALGEVQRLVARSWVCVGATPVMVRELAGPPGGGESTATDTPRVGRLESGEEIAQARSLVLQAFDLDAPLAQVVFPDPADGHRLWGAFDGGGRLRACLALVRVGDAAVVLSMATDATQRGHGWGSAALAAGLRDAAVDGARHALLYSSPTSDGFYRRVGFRDVERWQIWSRPRWVLGRT